MNQISNEVVATLLKRAEVHFLVEFNHSYQLINYQNNISKLNVNQMRRFSSAYQTTTHARLAVRHAHDFRTNRLI